MTELDESAAKDSLDAESDARARRLLAADLRSRILTFTRKTAAGVGETRIGLGAAGRSRIELAALDELERERPQEVDAGHA